MDTDTIVRLIVGLAAGYGAFIFIFGVVDQHGRWHS